MNANKRFTIPAAVAALSIVGSSAFAADLLAVDTDEETVGNTKVNFDSSFEDLNYTLGETITMLVTWRVEEGAAKFVRYEPRPPFFTPRGVNGTSPQVIEGSLMDSSVADTTGEVRVEFEFTDLHCDQERDVEIGNAHHSLVLKFDTDEDLVPDTDVGLGINVHVEDPGCTSENGGGPPPWAGGR